MNSFLVALVICCAYCNAMPSEFALTEEQTQEITQFIEEVMDCKKIPGLTISVTTANASLWEQGFGYEELQGSKVSPDTRFAIASLSKAFTSALVAILIGKGTKLGDKR
jgi:CubicO group peptidase (beta-lactamase class C family)